jgi:hypothetical protein
MTEELAKHELQLKVVGESIESNIAELEAYIQDKIAIYRGANYAQGDIAQAKRDRAAMNNLAKDIDSRRLAFKKAYMAPYDAVEAQIKDRLIEPIKEVSAQIDAFVKEGEEKARAKLRYELQKHWEEYAGVLSETVPYEQIERSEWLNKTYGMGKAFADIENIVEKAARDEDTIKSLGLEYEDDALAEYWATLDVSKAIARNKELVERAMKAAQLKAAEEEIASLREETDAKPAEPIVAKVTPTEETLRTWTVTFTGTKEQAQRVVAFCGSIGLTGKAVCE